ncbi:hypothetical protein KLA_16702 [Cellulophaga geojensis KL-A]|uniref:Uncharacterized protein n=1 Tax=Cellulophaga geojensis KL-A TaxID=1328323 RepID=A0ABN0RJK1_9FLAO|nr:hypothetical protein [Cellulophaga geojensis]EWH10474.1 hypothetical protein KLA_16702 [Cellulophaga geojensis KL-A]
MFREIEKKESVGYGLSERGFYNIRFLGEKAEIDFDSYQITIDKKDFSNSFFWKEYFIISNSNSKNVSVFLGDSLIDNLSGFINSVNNEYLILNKKVSSDRSLNILNKDFNIVVTFENSWAKWLINTDVFIFSEYRNLEILKVYNFNTKSIIEISIPLDEWSGLDGEKNKNRIYQTIGQWKNELLVFIGRFRLISFDLETGKELWRIDDFIKEVSSNPIFDFTNGVSAYVKWHLSGSEDEAYLLVRNCLFKLDLNNKKSQLIKDYNESTEQEWYFKHSRLYDDYITFSGANVLGKFPMVAGVIDRNTKEILWTTKCEPGVYFEEAPQIKEDKLYILDSSKTLRIFEEI